MLLVPELVFLPYDSRKNDSVIQNRMCIELHSDVVGSA